ncbi:PDZ and LIM domain protein Zasp-like isoform X2 [Varroa destructor]|uniref:PDZ and LIM domain protein Zasp n=1 Tax=Varroa destructor TaxID=109461 RepID=A0A7M7JAQ1_VARDE|nr:PDZ and LIM domain protein Zasp-like isoform X2 [Varroa destructor]
MSETTVKLMRGDKTPWGFRLGGGKDFGYPICVQRSTPGSLAEQAGIRTGDQIVRICERPTELMSHQDAQAAILNAGNYLELTVVRGGALTWAPAVQPVGDIVLGSEGPLTRTSLAAHKQPHAPIGSAHNITAKPFQVPGSTLVNKQYNCPAALYSMENIRDALEKQAEVLTGGAKGINFMKEDKPLNTDSAVYRMVQEEDKAPRTPASPLPRQTSGIDSSPLGAAQSGLRHVEAPRPTPQPAAPHGNIAVGGPNICVECGKIIVGVFCRIKDRNIHAECFRCATCGTSLKNQGYFLVGGKLYCDMHARNASVMLKEPVSPSSNAPVVPLSTPASISSTPASSTPYGAHPSSLQFRSVPPPLSPRPDPQRGSGCFDASTIPAPGGSSSPANVASRWPPQQQKQQQQQQQRTQQQSVEQTTTTTTTTSAGSGLNPGAGNWPAPRRGRGLLSTQAANVGRIPICASCNVPIRGPFVSAIGKSWCPAHFMCANATCRRDLMDCGFVEERNQLYCETCFENYMAPSCSKCHQRIKGDCLKAMDRPWHPTCFTCSYCRRPFGNNSFYLEDGKPYCEKDWNDLFTSKCFGCGYPIEAGDRWVEALNNNYHSTCFKCTVCHNALEGQSFYAKAGKPYCRLHAR